MILFLCIKAAERMCVNRLLINPVLARQYFKLTVYIPGSDETPRLIRKIKPVETAALNSKRGSC